MNDLFDWTPQSGYPHAPGWKESTTSKAAAKAAGITACQLREDLMTLYRAAWPAGMTADEAAGKVGRSLFAVRPRISELRKIGQLHPALTKGPDSKPLRRANASGMLATVLICRRPETP